MADVFNRNPVDFVEMNDLFTVLNDKVGLTSTQWQKAIENTYYLRNHLGLADVNVGSVETIFTEPGKLADVIVSHREVEIDGKTIDYFDYTFYIPSPKIEANLTSQIVEDENEVGMELTQTPIYGTGSLSDHIVGYKFDFLAKTMGGKILDNYLEKTKRITSGGGASEITVGTDANASSSSNRYYVSSSQINLPSQNDAFEFEVNNGGVYFGYGINAQIQKQKLASEEYVDNAIASAITTVLNTEV